MCLDENQSEVTPAKPNDSATVFLRRYVREGDHTALVRLVEQTRPLVRSVCLAKLRNAEQAEDATQETFLKLASKAHTIHGNVSAWLSRTASTTSIDLIRREARERQRRRTLAEQQPTEPDAPLPSETQIAQALSAIDPAMREVLQEYFLERQPLRVLAARRQVSVTAAHRRVQAALAQAREVLADSMHLDHPNDPGSMLYNGRLEDALRTLAPEDLPRHAVDRPTFPGWTRPIRVGVIVSRTNFDQRNKYPYSSVVADPEWSVDQTAILCDPRFELFGVVEPENDTTPTVERIVRDYELTQGMIDLTDAESLGALDVLVAGNARTIPGQAVVAIEQAVRKGMGFYNIHLFATNKQLVDKHKDSVLALCLADGEMGARCECRLCQRTGDLLGRHVTASVKRSHPVLGGLTPGCEIEVVSCGRVYRPAPKAKVLVEQNHISESKWSTSGRPMRMRVPVLVAGPLGQGRVLAINANHPGSLTEHPQFGGTYTDYLTQALRWLAEPRQNA